jgi:dienelactone hydrolase
MTTTRDGIGRSYPVQQGYHVQQTAETKRGGFPYFAHHESVSALWSQKWRGPSAAASYPFGEGNVADFEPVFAELIETSGDDPAILRRPDDYARPFLPVARRLVTDAERALAENDVSAAREFFLRAATVYRIARFPVIRTPLTREAWEEGRAAYERGSRLLDPPSVPVDIPFKHADASAGDSGAPVRAYLRVPTGARPKAGWPVLLLLGGLDGYRTDLTWITQAHADRGLVTLTFEIPGTGDCPAAPGDPASSERLVNSVLDWVIANGPDYGLDETKIILRGVSTGGYHAARAAHMHADRLLAVVVHGGGSHHMFDPEWIRHQNQMEYPFALADALAWKFGYRDADPETAIGRYAAEAQEKFSLVSTGIIGTPACGMLVLNGMEDSIFPIEDSFIMAADGTGKDLVVRGSSRHMGEPGAQEIISDWIENAIRAAG